MKFRKPLFRFNLFSRKPGFMLGVSEPMIGLGLVGIMLTLAVPAAIQSNQDKQVYASATLDQLDLQNATDLFTSQEGPLPSTSKSEKMLTYLSAADTPEIVSGNDIPEGLRTTGVTEYVRWTSSHGRTYVMPRTPDASGNLPIRTLTQDTVSQQSNLLGNLNIVYGFQPNDLPKPGVTGTEPTPVAPPPTPVTPMVAAVATTPTSTTPPVEGGGDPNVIVVVPPTNPVDPNPIPGPTIGGTIPIVDIMTNVLIAILITPYPGADPQVCATPEQCGVTPPQQCVSPPTQTTEIEDPPVTPPTQTTDEEYSDDANAEYGDGEYTDDDYEDSYVPPAGDPNAPPLTLTPINGGQTILAKTISVDVVDIYGNPVDATFAMQLAGSQQPWSQTISTGADGELDNISMSSGVLTNLRITAVGMIPIFYMTDFTENQTDYHIVMQPEVDYVMAIPVVEGFSQTFQAFWTVTSESLPAYQTYMYNSLGTLFNGDSTKIMNAYSAMVALNVNGQAQNQYIYVVNSDGSVVPKTMMDYLNNTYYKDENGAEMNLYAAVMAANGGVVDPADNEGNLATIASLSGTIFTQANGGLVPEYTPVKVTLTGANAKMNSDDHFVIALSGFKGKTPWARTTGGLNIDEAWLMTDRDRDGLLYNNVVDGNDVFGNHFGKFDNGYNDLANLYKDSLKTDEHGKKYIPLKKLNWFDKSWISVSRFFGMNKDWNPSYDLKLLNRSQQILNASDLLTRVYVDYKEVKEFDKDKQNAIFQRANVMYSSGKVAESADQRYRAAMVSKAIR